MAMTSVRQPRFSASPVPVLGVVVFTALVGALSVIAHQAVFGPDFTAHPDHLSAVLSLPFSAVILLGTWVVLRREGVPAADIGLARSTLLPGLFAFGLFWASATVVGVAYLVGTGATGELGVAPGMPWYWVPVWFVLMLTVSNGLTEEFVFRGYVQSKCTALANGGSRVPAPAAGILAAAFLFGVPHIPLALIGFDASVRAVPWVLLNNLLPGIAYGLVYYLTRNLWYTGFVHGFANATLVPFDPAAVPGFVPVASLLALLIGLGYRYWAGTTERVTVGRRPMVSSTE